MLPDLLKQNLKVVFCGTAAGNVSAMRQAYYAGPGNQFYTILNKTGITDRLLNPVEYPGLVKFGVGLTDIVKVQAGMDSYLNHSSFDVDSFNKKITKYQPKIVAFNGKKSAAWALGHKGRTGRIEYGRSTTKIGKSIVFVMPSTSGAARGFWDEKYWFDLASEIKKYAAY